MLGARVRPSGPDADASAAVDATGPRRARRRGRAGRGGLVALAALERVTFTYPGASAPALQDVSLARQPALVEPRLDGPRHVRAIIYCQRRTVAPLDAYLEHRARTTTSPAEFDQVEA